MLAWITFRWGCDVVFMFASCTESDYLLQKRLFVPKAISYFISSVEIVVDTVDVVVSNVVFVF